MQGIVVGSDQTQEWILPWWWKRYTKFNTLPVVFFDFGMSEAAKNWCRERGQVIPLPYSIEPCPPSGVSKKMREQWTCDYDERIWVARKCWFQKPRALLQSPFKKSIWVDLDCEILGDLSPLFAYTPLAAALDAREGVNTGVLVFEQDHPLLQKWATFAIANTHLFAGDQDALNALLKNEAINILPQIYNWRASSGHNPDARIIHWLGPFGKEMISLASSLENDLLSFGVFSQQ